LTPTNSERAGSNLKAWSRLTPLVLRQIDESDHPTHICLTEACSDDLGRRAVFHHIGLEDGI
jgi:hypothetical protein